jgi:hypothetical protein
MSGCTRCWKARELEELKRENEYLIGLAERLYMGDRTDEEARGVACYRVTFDLAVEAGRLSREEADESIAYQKSLYAAV